MPQLVQSQTEFAISTASHGYILGAHVNECTLPDDVMNKCGGPVATTRVLSLSHKSKKPIHSSIKVCGCYAVTFLDEHLDLIGMWFSEDQRANIIKTHA